VKNHFLINTLSSFFYIGYIPGAPGTWASLLAVMIWLLLPVQSIVVQILIVSLAFLVGIYVSGLSEVNSGIVDPSFVVIDEVAGMWLALLLLPRLPYPHYLTIVLLAFVVFRILDITKIFPINKLEQMSGGFGIMMDDIAAGLLTAISINLIIWVI